MDKVKITLKVNGQMYEIDVRPDLTLADLLREELDLTGTKKGCGVGECGACTVLVDGQAVNSCLILAPQVNGSEVMTVEGLTKEGQLDSLQEAFIRQHAVQCGFCTPGMLMSSKALLIANPHPSPQEIKRAISGNLCRCTGYWPIIQAVEEAAAGKGSEK